MRIIGGKFRKKSLEFPKNLKTRPLKDNVRENIFNILNHSKNVGFEIENSIVLDLYAGTGSFGLECLSRYASKVVFVENELNALKCLKNNINNLDLKNKTKIEAVNAELFKLNKNINKKFDLVFLDPPYNNRTFTKLLIEMKKKIILNEKNIIIIHREINSKDNLEKYINIIENRIYGRSEIFFGRVF